MITQLKTYQQYCAMKNLFCLKHFYFSIATYLKLATGKQIYRKTKMQKCSKSNLRNSAVKRCSFCCCSLVNKHKIPAHLCVGNHSCHWKLYLHWAWPCQYLSVYRKGAFIRKGESRCKHKTERKLQDSTSVKRLEMCSKAKTTTTLSKSHANGQVERLRLLPIIWEEKKLNALEHWYVCYHFSDKFRLKKSESIKKNVCLMLKLKVIASSDAVGSLVNECLIKGHWKKLVSEWKYWYQSLDIAPDAPSGVS